MKTKQGIYECLGVEYPYTLYFPTPAEIGDFKKLFLEQKETTNRHLSQQGASGKLKYSTQEWARQKVKLCGFLWSRPELFRVTSANNVEHPFQIYSIELK